MQKYNEKWLGGTEREEYVKKKREINILMETKEKARYLLSLTFMNNSGDDRSPMFFKAGPFI